MKKSWSFLLILAVIILGYWIYVYSGLDQFLIQLILINIIVYILRSILIRIFNSAIKNQILRFSISAALNLIWIAFIFILLFEFSPIYTLSIISFLVIAISLTIKDLISNTAAGILILSSQLIEPGDLIEISGTSGIIDQINLNYTKLKEFDGVVVYIPNYKIFSSSVTKYTHKEVKHERSLNFLKPKKEDLKLKQYLIDFSKIITSQEKITSYIKVVQATSSVDPLRLEEQLNDIFDKYERILGIRSTYNIDFTTFDRLQITLRINSLSPILVLRYADAFIRDVLFSVNHNEIFEGWEEYKKISNLKLEQ